jgi:alkylation response protein AidB-like acyl-CoA dehydrogenase
MNPSLRPEQEELSAAVRVFCERRRQKAGSDNRAEDVGTLLQEVAGLGWLSHAAPTGVGGAGASLTDRALLFAEASRGLLPHRILSAMRGAHALAGLAPESPLLGKLFSGEEVLAIALDETTARDPAFFETSIEDAAGTPVVVGAKAYVCGGPCAGVHLVAARESGGISLGLVDAGERGVQIQEVKSFAGEPQAHVTYDRVPLLERLGPAGEGRGLFDDVVRSQQALALAEMVGGMEAVVDMTVAYVKERDQFGQKIALFQAVRHQIADMGIRRTSARHLAWRAISRLDRGSCEGVELPAALAFVGRAFKEICFTAHHLHGGAGFVLEHPLREYSERAQALALRFAPEEPALAEIAALLLDSGEASV